MSLWRHLTRGLRVLAHRADADRELDDELRFYLEEAVAAHVARGLSPDAALRAARAEIGNATAAREEVRAHGWENLVSNFTTDLRYAGRRLRRAPGFTAVCVVTLALGIGAATAIFSAVNPLLLEPLPYSHANRIVMLSDDAGNGARQDVTFGTYEEIAARARSFSDIAVTDRWQPSIVGTGEPERLSGERVSASYFTTLGVHPVVGRDFMADDDRPGAARVAIISDGLLRRHFGNDRGILGRPVLLDGDQYLIVGIMPPDFENVLTPGGEIWAPLQAVTHAGFNSREWGHHYRMIARLRADVSLEQARSEIDGISRNAVAAFVRPPWAKLQPQGLLVHRLQDDVIASARPALLAALGAVLLVLIIACVNVTNLLLARAAQRRGELAMRSALGAGTGRLTRQLLTESLTLATLGALLGVVVAEVGVRALVILSPPGLPRLGAIRVDGPALAFTIVLTTVIGLLIGLAPALDVSRADLRRGLESFGRGASGGHRIARNTLVVAEVALALVLLVSAGLLLRSIQRLFAGGPGFDGAHVVTMEVVEAGHAYHSDTARYQSFAQALNAVRRVPGVTAAAFTSQLPLSGDNDAYGIVFESIPRKDPNDYGSAFRYMVTPGYFTTMHIPLLRGRLLDSTDRPAPAGHIAAGTSTPPVLINESLAKRMFPNRDPIGERVRAGPQIIAGAAGGVVVGVVGDVKQISLADGATDAFYVAAGQWWWMDDVQSLVVRTSGDPRVLIPAIRNAIWSVDRNQPILRVSTLDAMVARSEAQRHFALVVFEAFAIAALVLAAIGIYGVLAGSVTERVRELGIRAALGASRDRIVGLVVRQGLTLTLIGVSVGVFGAAAATRALVSLLYGVSRLDPMTYAGVVVVLATVSAAACVVPAWRAARVDPLIALRSE